MAAVTRPFSLTTAMYFYKSPFAIGLVIVILVLLAAAGPLWFRATHD